MDYRDEVIALWKQSKLSRYEFAQATGVTYPSLCRFLKTASGKTVAEKLIPFVYGDKRSLLLARASAACAPASAPQLSTEGSTPCLPVLGTSDGDLTSRAATPRNL